MQCMHVTSTLMLSKDIYEFIFNENKVAEFLKEPQNIAYTQKYQFSNYFTFLCTKMHDQSHEGATNQFHMTMIVHA